MITLILSHDESQKIGRHILSGRPYIFTNIRFSDDGGTFEKDFELFFIERVNNYGKNKNGNT